MNAVDPSSEGRPRRGAIPFRLCDVFTDRPLAGNALAVFTDAVGLNEATMQALAREMNLSESAFVLPPTEASADARVRIFTPTMELPFAGHPTLGTAFVLGASRGLDVVRLETRRGVVEVQLTRRGDRPTFGWMNQPIPRYEPYAATTKLFAALGIRGSLLPVELYDNGPHYVFVELASPGDVASLRPDQGALAALGTTAFVVVARDGARWKARVFAPGEGIPEDPATGAAAGPLALHLARHGRVPFDVAIVIDQGTEIGRPSVLWARVSAGVTCVEVGGAAVIVGAGEFNL
jgi:trans-2,3-dihydro-3-hydroxyanthranilate isomerase